MGRDRSCRQVPEHGQQGARRSISFGETSCCRGLVLGVDHLETFQDDVIALFPHGVRTVVHDKTFMPRHTSHTMACFDDMGHFMEERRRD